jgi:hypothetical protein
MTVRYDPRVEWAREDHLNAQALTRARESASQAVQCQRQRGSEPAKQPTPRASGQCGGWSR